METHALSYLSRLSPAEPFGRLVTLETHRRGTASAGTVVAVNDGARWIQEVIDLQRPDALRILDFAHAVSHLGQLAQTLYGPGSEAASTWLGEQTHALRHGQDPQLLARLQELMADPALKPEVLEVLSTTVGYFAARREQIRYAAFAAAGYPIGSGCVESANKLLVEARLKGAGMHWRRAHVNPMLALRCLERNRRWEREWPTLWQAWREQVRERVRARRRARQTRPRDPLPDPIAVMTPTPKRPSPATSQPKLVLNGKPTANHPWRHFSLLSAKR